jgi:hypothetical protein
LRMTTVMGGHVPIRSADQTVKRSPYRSYAQEITNSRTPAQDLDDELPQTPRTELPLAWPSQPVSASAF